MSQSPQRSIHEDRNIEFDSLALVMLGIGFIAVVCAAAFIIGLGAGGIDAAVITAAICIGALVVVAWIVGYPRHATAPLIGLVLIAAAEIVPRLIRIQDVLLPEAAQLTPSRLYVVGGLYLGGVAMLLLAFMICAFIGPAISACLRVRRREQGALATLQLHGALRDRLHLRHRRRDLALVAQPVANHPQPCNTKPLAQCNRSARGQSWLHHSTTSACQPSCRPCAPSPSASIAQPGTAPKPAPIPKPS